MQEIILATVKTPLLPQLIHDDETRLTIFVAALLIAWGCLVEILRRYNQ
jgi:hypothetical protein